MLKKIFSNPGTYVVMIFAAACTWFVYSMFSFMTPGDLSVTALGLFTEICCVWLLTNDVKKHPAFFTSGVMITIVLSSFLLGLTFLTAVSTV